MTSVMLACYPETFAGGAIVAGLPYGAAANVQEAFQSMFQCPTRPAREWGDLVRAAAPHPSAWPRISIWHGSADTTVIPVNALETLKQWTDVHGLPLTPSVQETIDGYPRQVWMNETGEAMIKSYTVTHMAHGTPLATGKADDQCGTAGPFLLEVGISSSYHIAKFFGLTKRSAVTADVAMDQNAHVSSLVPRSLALPANTYDEETIETIPERPNIPRIDVAAIITKALTAAGLMKSP